MPQSDFAALLSLLCHYGPSKPGENARNQVKLNIGASTGWQEDLFNLLSLEVAEVALKRPTARRTVLTIFLGLHETQRVLYWPAATGRRATRV